MTVNALSLGTAVVPESAPGDPVVLVVPFVPDMPGVTYDVDLLLPAELPSTDVVVTAKDVDNVTLTVTRPDGYAGAGLTIFALCADRVDLDTTTLDVSAYLDPGFTGWAGLRKYAQIVYFQFELTATATIDGTPKADPVQVLDVTAANALIAPDFFASTANVDAVGVSYTDANDLMRAYTAFDFGDSHHHVFVEGAAETTGNWVDGVSTLYGQVSWFAGS